MDAQQVVQSISMGSRVAEDEAKELAAYFVETENWRKVYEGEADVIFAPKGGGKSAIYSMLISRESDFFDRRILLATAENPKGDTAFAEVEKAPPTSEAEFIGLWKIYFLTLVAQTLTEYDIHNVPAEKLLTKLQEAELLPSTRAPRRQLVRTAMDFVKSFFRPVQSLETSITADPASGTPVIVPKITFVEPNPQQRKAGTLYVDELYDFAEEALERADHRMWILLDRLDIAFADSAELEANALRGLFRVYRDLQTRSFLELKIFLRSDIWETITRAGFREASHITRDLRIEWNENTLVRLAVQRLLRSDALRTHYGVAHDEVLSDVERQKAFFYQVFPRQVDQGSRRPSTIDWCLARTKDGTGQNAPRELIHLLTETRNSQLTRLETGQAAAEAGALFVGQAFKDALPAVSKARLTQTLYAEHPSLRDYISKMEGQKSRQNDISLATIWDVTEPEAASIADQLVIVGFFEPRQGDYWVPFLYRPALEMLQGSAEGVAAATDEDDVA